MKNKGNRVVDISDLANRILLGDRDAENEFAKKYRTKIFYIIKRKNIPKADAEDLTQDVLQSVILQCRKNKIENLSGYIWKICNNKFIDWIHEKKKQILISIEPEMSIEDPYSNPDEKIKSEEEQLLLENAFHKLSKREQNIFNLILNEKLQSPEIGNRLGLKEANVRKIKERALEKLKKSLRNFIQ